MLHTSSGGVSSGATAGEDGPSEHGPMSIGAVLGRLREEFPEVTVSKIRFLESEGLVEPQRTPSGYRKFSERDVERLAFVLRMQRDHYLPLKVIREQVAAMDRGEQVSLPGPAQPRDLLDGAAAPLAAPDAGRMSRSELLAAADISEEQLAEWESFGLLAPARTGGYPAEAVEVARLVADLGRFGLEPRHLRSVKAAADREAGFVEQVVAPLRRHRDARTRARAEATARELATLAVRLHATLVQTALREQRV
ncbi:transcriptional regulator FtsR [Streptomyces sp. WMMC897]|uniref:transcriptional regulator FtsR n=1 Tax=Streptomyces sp. WMMC897 TaxID=3014782 RepID=UPI0022B6FDFB|nr:MerR family transcriptional regulator [Streptomyces sp. WMMC897]MCZ7415551.1 MerR family transcriptional regulator [Streptomyces sp. WMMC897]